MIIDNQNYRIEAPDSGVLYAFTPTLFTVASKKTAHTKVDMTITGEGGYSYTDSRALYGGSATFDISRALQMMFTEGDVGQVINYDPSNSPTLTNLAKTFTVEWLFSGDTILTISTRTTPLPYDVIFGAMTARTSSLQRRLRWFVNFPQTIDLPLRDGSVITWPAGSVSPFGEEKEDGGSAYFRALQPLPIVSGSAPMHPFEIIITDTERIVGDLQESSIDASIRVTPDRSACGTFLRWVDRLGRRLYWLFRETGRSSDVEQEEEWSRSALRSPLRPYGQVFYPSPDDQALTSADTVTLTAQFVSAEEFDDLSTIASSSFVDIFEGYADGAPLWRRVVVKPGSVSKSYGNTSTFSVSIIEAKVKSPAL